MKQNIIYNLEDIIRATLVDKYPDKHIVVDMIALVTLIDEDFKKCKIRNFLLKRVFSKLDNNSCREFYDYITSCFEKEQRHGKD